jgi:hypothetical protein
LPCADVVVRVVVMGVVPGAVVGAPVVVLVVESPLPPHPARRRATSSGTARRPNMA